MCFNLNLMPGMFLKGSAPEAGKIDRVRFILQSGSPQRGMVCPHNITTTNYTFKGPCLRAFPFTHCIFAHLQIRASAHQKSAHQKICKFAHPRIQTSANQFIYRPYRNPQFLSNFPLAQSLRRKLIYFFGKFISVHL